MPFIGVQPASALLSSADIQDGQITTAKLADTAVTTAKITDDAVTGSKIENSPTIANGLTLTDGDITLASGHGISFSATSDTSATGASMASEVLDDYEEGNWTPVPYGNSTAGTFSNSGGTYGKYIKIGQMVYVSCVIQGSISSPSGTARISGLPFATDSDLGFSAPPQWNNMPFATIGEEDHQIQALFYTSYIHFRGNDRRVNEPYAGIDWGGGSPQNIHYLRIGGCYKTT